VNLATAFLSLGAGAMLGLLGIGLVVIYRGCHTLNLAQGAMATLGAYAFYQLNGVFGLPVAIAVLLAIVITAAVGALIDLCVMRRLVDSSPVTRIIACLAVVLIIQASLELYYGSGAEPVNQILPANKISLFGVGIGVDRLYLLGIAVALTAALWLFYRYSKFGIATTAAAENPVAASSLGLSARLLGTGNWAIGGALAGLAGVMIAQYQGLEIDSMTLLIVPTLAAALFGGFRSYPLTLVGALVVGIVQNETTAATNLLGASSLVPLVLIVGVMLLRGRSIPARGFSHPDLPAVTIARINWPVVVIVLGAVVISVWTWIPIAWNTALLVNAMFAIVILSVVIITGFAGQVSLAQFGFAGVGAYIAATAAGYAGWPFLPALLCGVVAAALASLLVALPSLRMKGPSLAVVSLGVSFVLESMIFDSIDVINVKPPTFFGLNINNLTNPKGWITFVLVVLTFLIIVAHFFRNSRMGRRVLAVRTNERAAASLGINVRRAKVYAFVFSAAIAGCGGVLIGFSSTAVTFTDFGVMSSLQGFGWAVVGGIGYVTGPLHGSSLVPGGLTSAIFNLFGATLQSYLPLIGGLATLSVILTRPNGLAAAFERSRKRPSDHQRGSRRSLWPTSAGRPEWRLEPVPSARPDRSDDVEADTVLEVRGVSVSFGGARALSDVSLDIARGKVKGLIGPNGAGKTTLVDVVTGYVRPQQGSVRLLGRPLDRIGPWGRAQAGILRSFQNLELFADLTVGENIRIASESNASVGWGARLGTERRPVIAGLGPLAVETLDLTGELDRRVSDLPYGRQRLVAIARALAADPKVLLLDEPAGGLDATEVRELADLIRRIASVWNIAVLVIEHDVEFVLAVSDDITVLDLGHVLVSGPPELITASAEVRAVYLGAPAPARDAASPASVFEKGVEL
jgi:ABC-type branched-subunit amino acid transport system ATPase component/branched-subunit amino acid ABC-type transport system permease component